MTKNLKTVSTAEYDAVVAQVMKYVNGLLSGKSKEVATAFHKDAIMYGMTGGPSSELLGGPISNLYDFVDKNGSAPNIAVRLDVLAITQTTAVVRVDMERDALDADYTDFHTLIKLDGKWNIVAKVFHKYDSE
ncbi:MAG: nuclear transport factor 2 family protein [Devosia sp.]